MADCGLETCQQKIKSSSKALQCEICDKWWHTGCADVTDADYKTLSKNISGVHWFCLHCDKGSAKLFQIIGKLTTELEICRTEINVLKGKVLQAAFNNDKQEQYSRKDSIRISGIADPHVKEEDTTDAILKVANDMGVTLNVGDISVSHRLGKVTSTYNRPVIVKLVRRDVKRQLMMNKKELRDKAGYKDVYLNDDLTTTRYKICKELRAQNKTVWTRDGKIIIKEADDSVSTIDSYQDFCKLNWNEEKLSELGILQ